LDAPGKSDLRPQNRPAHVEYITKNVPKGAQFTGGLFGPDGKTVIGSMYVADFDSLDAARTFHENDPYAKAGIYGQVIVAPCINVAKPA
jgi:uncharacterized protein YciI